MNRDLPAKDASALEDDVMDTGPIQPVQDQWPLF